MRKILTLTVVAGLFGLTGCSVFMAAKQPGKKDLGVLNSGTPRSLVLAELGQPVASETRDGSKVDVFSFTQGYGKAAKTGRALFHGAADVFTLGLWEVVGTPTEAIFDGKKMAVEVSYDQGDRVAKVVDLRPEGQGIRVSQPKEVVAEEKPARVASTNFSPRKE